MKIILIQDVDKLGDRGEVLEVKDGFARNYLIPQNLAIIASKSNMNTLENERKGREKKLKREMDQAKSLAEDISKLNIVIKAKCGEEGKLFGSVTAQDIADAVAEQSKFQVEKKKIEMSEPLKKIGTYTIVAKLSKGVSADIHLEVVPEE
jgi:large subunit ribosomal protein L9